LFALGARHDLSVVSHAVTAVRAWRTGLAGELNEAECLVKQAGELGRAAQLDNASYGTAVQLLCLEWARGRFGSLLPVFELADAETRTQVSNRVMRSRALAAAGRPRDPLWSMVMIVAAEAAYMVNAPDTARGVHRLLVPFASQVAFARNWVIAPIALGAALAGACAGTPDTDDLFQQAVDITCCLDAPVLRARAEISWVWSAFRRSVAGQDRIRASARIEDARAVFADRGLRELDQSAAELAARVAP
jgi:hypothetical protein